ncbi:MAG: sigma-54-dependent Fis family transcriptional regulator [Pyrinomonadaceae bacterium]|nr:sigma-54-dependent Fis family transcriptional regulator [Pyrinomonadaceae bacterium]
MKTRILVVEDDESLRSVLLESIEKEGHQGFGAESVEAAEKLLEDSRYDVVLTDINLPGNKNGLDLLPVILAGNPETYIMVMTGYGTIENAIIALKRGAADFLRKPIILKDLVSAIRVAVEKTKDRPERPALEPPQSVSAAAAATAVSHHSRSEIIAESQVMISLLEQVATVAPYKVNVLVTGETGTGKELIAREIHIISPRSNGPFIALNCAAVPENLLEDELFGHVKGAYTGAQADRKGRFEQADGGTLFLDEIGDMNMSLQAKLLRVLQEREFEKLGANNSSTVDVRVLAATSADLEEKIEQGEFRADLYHRLNVVHLNIPPLRERPDDVIPIARGLLSRFCADAGLPDMEISEEIEGVLRSNSYPGNVRQLQNAMERAAVFAGMDELSVEHLPDEIRNQSEFSRIKHGFVPTSIPDEGIDFTEIVSNIEKEILLRTLDKTNGNKMQAARLLNMKRTTLVEKVKRLDIDKEFKKAG